MKKKKLLLLTIFVILAVVTGFLVNFVLAGEIKGKIAMSENSIAKTTVSATSKTNIKETPKVTETDRAEALGIKPRLTPSGPTEPTFTEADVRRYVATHPVEGTVYNSLYTIEKIEFMTTRDLRVRLEMRASAPDDALLCVVKIRGTFEISGPLSPEGTLAKPLKYSVVYQIFLAQSGKLIDEKFDIK